MQAIEKKILSRVYGHGEGWALTKVDLVAEFVEVDIHQSLLGIYRHLKTS